jgi:hypothetical protein
VTLGALDTLVNGKRETTAEQQADMFATRRADVERAAIDKFARGDLERGMVVLRPEDFRQG